MRSKSLLAAAVLGGLMTAAAPAIADAGLPKALTQSRPQFAIRPAQISYTGDGTGILGGAHGGRHGMGAIRWTAWTAHEARGNGSVWLDDCTPSCAQGSFSPRPMTVVLSAPRGGTFRHFALRYTDHGKRYVDRRSIRRVGGGYWEYALGF